MSKIRLYSKAGNRNPLQEKIQDQIDKSYKYIREIEEEIQDLNRAPSSGPHQDQFLIHVKSIIAKKANIINSKYEKKKELGNL